MTVLLIAVSLVVLGWLFVWRLIVWGCEEPLSVQKRKAWWSQ